jgi:homoserine O-succinyltransferase
MSIILPEGLASAALLRREGLEVLHRRPGCCSVLRVGLLNLMPDMTRTEIQFARLLGAPRRHVELVLALPSSYRSGYEGIERYARWGEASLQAVNARALLASSHCRQRGTKVFVSAGT